MSDNILNKIHLEKNIYEAKQAKDILDEEFSEFLPKTRNISEFFEIYNKKFYSILNKTHEFFIQNSLNYIKEWTNPKETTIENLNLEISNINFEILSAEKFHPIFPNRIILSPSPSSQFDNITNCILFYMHSGKARLILGDQKEPLFNMIKSRERSQNTLNQDFIIPVDSSITTSLTKGKPIKKERDLNDSFYTLNTYNGPTDQ